MDWIKESWVDNNFCLDVSSAVRNNRKLEEIAVDVVTKISKRYPPPYTLMMSGGIDSQSMLWCWLQTDIPFNVTTVRYTDYDGNILNEHDVSNMENVSELYGVPVNYINFNLIEFLENDLYCYAITYRCTSPQITAYIKMSEMINTGTIMFSGDFLFSAVYNYTVLGMKRYADSINNEKRKVIPFFLLHDSELAAAVSHDDTFHNPANGFEFSYKRKVSALESSGIKLIPQKIKYSGFENVKTIYDKRYDLVTAKERLRYFNKPSKRFFDIIFRYRLTEIVKYEDNIVWIT
jgi:hypothetical protein